MFADLPKTDSISSRASAALLSGMAEGQDLATLKAQIARELDLTPRQVDAYHAWITIRQKKLQVPGDAAASLLNASSLPGLELVRVPNSDEGIPDSKPVSAAHTNYDFANKIIWRERWKEFLQKVFTEEERKKAKIICLPSKKPEREINLYIDLGFLPENIYAVEGDPSAYVEFEEGCKKLKVNHVCGRLEDVLGKPPLDHKFDVVSYDFHGPLSFNSIDILLKTAISRDAAVLINHLAARENKVTQKVLQAMDLAASDSAWQEVRSKLNEKGILYPGKVDREVVKANLEEGSKLLDEFLASRFQPKLSDIREGLLANIILSYLKNGWKPAGLSKRLLQFEDNFPNMLPNASTAQLRIVQLLDSVEKFNNSFLRDIAGVVRISPKELYLFFKDYLSIQGRPTQLERYRYYSQASKKHSPYISAFVAINTPIDIYSAIDFAGSSLVDFFTIRLKDELEAINGGMLHRYKIQCNPSHNEITFVRDGKLAWKMSLEVLEKALNKWRQNLKNYPPGLLKTKEIVLGEDET